MPSNAELDELMKLAAQAGQNLDWSCFADYLVQRSKGLRTSAMRSLSRFIKEAREWNLQNRKDLLFWLHKDCAAERLGSLLVPDTLRHEVAVPTTLEWLKVEPNSADATYFFALYPARECDDADSLALFRRTIELDSTHQPARMAFAEKVLRGVEYSQHELPRGYLGSVTDDLADLQEAIALAQGIDNEQACSRFVHDLAGQLELARAWSDFCSDENATDFARWCAEHDRSCGTIDTPY